MTVHDEYRDKVLMELNNDEVAINELNYLKYSGKEPSEREIERADAVLEILLNGNDYYFIGLYLNFMLRTLKMKHKAPNKTDNYLFLEAYYNHTLTKVYKVHIYNIITVFENGGEK